MMTIALDLARKGAGQVEPNPAVGAVLVKKHQIIGQGYHHRYGAPHAEVDALHDAKSRGQTVKGSTLYVTLEPCCHWGKTPPCTDAIIAAGIKKVIVAVEDPSKKVAGKGISILKKAGIEVAVGLMAQEAEDINPWFFKFHRTRKPWVICKWAQTLDGKLAARTGHSKWISGDASRQETHRVRRTCQAIVVGIQTVLADNPHLTVRLDDEPNPHAAAPNRVVLDSRLKIPLASYLVRTARDVPTWVFTTRRAKASSVKQLQARGVNVQIMPSDTEGQIDLRKFLSFAASQGWARIFIEGGATLHSRVLLDNLADELIVFQASSLAMDAQAFQFHGRNCRLASQFLRKFRFQSVSKVGEDTVLRLLRK